MAFLPVVGPIVQKYSIVTCALADRQPSVTVHYHLTELEVRPEASLRLAVLDEVFMGADHKKFIKVMRRGESLVLMGRAQHQGV